MATTNSQAGDATGWTDDERAAMKAHAEELRAEGRAGAKKADGLEACLAKIAEMSEPDRSMAERIHAIVTAAAPELDAKTWYGMPAWAKGGKLLCFFTPAEKFKERYASFGFNAVANLDEGTMWPTAWAITKLTPADEKRIGELVKRAARDR